MGKHDFRYFFHEGLSNMFSHGFMSFAAIGITVACLLIMGTFSLVAWNANALLEDLERENEILAYVDDTYTESQAKALESKLERVPNVASATFISREEAMKSFAEQYPDEALFQDLDPEIFRDRYSLKLDDLELMSLLVKINQLGTTVVVVTHEKDLVNHFCKRVVTIESGVVVNDGIGCYVGGRIHG